MRALVPVSLFLMLLASSAAADSGLISKKSAHSVGETVSRLEKAAKEDGLVVFARIDHAAGARSVGQTLRPTELLVFGNPKPGTPLMQSNQAIGIDLPLKALAFEDERREVWLIYNAPAHLATRHGITDRAAVVDAMTKALDRLTDIATRP
jgi:uncharacterized protein (DUF302 family)